MYLRAGHWEMVGSEILATTPVFSCQLPYLGRLPVPQWYVLVVSLQGGNYCSEGQNSPFIRLAQSLALGVLVEQETGRLWAADPQL